MTRAARAEIAPAPPAWREPISSRRRERSACRVLFVGSESQRAELEREMRLRGGLRLVGYAPARSRGQAGAAGAGLAEAVAEVRPSTLVVSSGALREEGLASEASDLHRRGLQVQTLGDFYERHFAKVPLSELSEGWLLANVALIPRPRIYGVVKRVVEGAVAATLLVFSAPVWPIVVVAVKSSSRGSVFYRQRRVGKGGRELWLTKLRTMRPADPAAPTSWATADAARITPVGRVLRRFRIDELPQLWAVVRGDLALVGPRPEQPHLVERLERTIEFYGVRHAIRPGLTGWAQVNYGYGGSFKGTLEKLQYDLFYIRHRSLRFDLRILAATVRTVVLGRGR